MSDAKTKQSNANVDKFLNSIEDETKRRDAIALARVFSEVTKEKPMMWGDSIVGYGKYRYKYASGKQGEWMVVGFSPRKNNLSLYLMSGFDEYARESGYDPEPLLGRLGSYSTGKSCLYIKSLKDVDQKVLKKLIQKSYEHMKKNNESS